MGAAIAVWRLLPAKKTTGTLTSCVGHSDVTVLCVLTSLLLLWRAIWTAKAAIKTNLVLMAGVFNRTCLSTSIARKNCQGMRTRRRSAQRSLPWPKRVTVPATSVVRTGVDKYFAGVKVGVARKTRDVMQRQNRQKNK